MTSKAYQFQDSLQDFVFGSCSQDLEDLKQLIGQREQEITQNLPPECHPPFEALRDFVAQAESNLAGIEDEVRRHWVTNLLDKFADLPFTTELQSAIDSILIPHRDRVCLAIRILKILLSADLDNVLRFFISPEALRESVRQIIGQALPPCPGPVREPIVQWISERVQELLGQVLDDTESSKAIAVAQLEALQSTQRGGDPSQDFLDFIPDFDPNIFIGSIATAIAGLLIASSLVAAGPVVGSTAAAASLLTVIIKTLLKRFSVKELSVKSPEQIMSELPNKDKLETATTAFLQGNKVTLASLNPNVDVASNFTNEDDLQQQFDRLLFQHNRLIFSELEEQVNLLAKENISNESAIRIAISEEAIALRETFRNCVEPLRNKLARSINDPRTCPPGWTPGGERSTNPFASNVTSCLDANRQQVDISLFPGRSDVSFEGRFVSCISGGDIIDLRLDAQIKEIINSTDRFPRSFWSVFQRELNALSVSPCRIDLIPQLDDLYLNAIRQIANGQKVDIVVANVVDTLKTLENRRSQLLEQLPPEDVEQLSPGPVVSEQIDAKFNSCFSLLKPDISKSAVHVFETVQLATSDPAQVASIFSKTEFVTQECPDEPTQRDDETELSLQTLFDFAFSEITSQIRSTRSVEAPSTNPITLRNRLGATTTSNNIKLIRLLETFPDEERATLENKLKFDLQQRLFSWFNNNKPLGINPFICVAEVLNAFDIEVYQPWVLELITNIPPFQAKSSVFVRTTVIGILNENQIDFTPKELERMLFFINDKLSPLAGVDVRQIKTQIKLLVLQANNFMFNRNNKLIRVIITLTEFSNFIESKLLQLQTANNPTNEELKNIVDNKIPVQIEKVVNCLEDRSVIKITNDSIELLQRSEDLVFKSPYTNFNEMLPDCISFVTGISIVKDFDQPITFPNTPQQDTTFSRSIEFQQNLFDLIKPGCPDFNEQIQGNLQKLFENRDNLKQFEGVNPNCMPSDGLLNRIFGEAVGKIRRTLNNALISTGAILRAVSINMPLSSLQSILDVAGSFNTTLCQWALLMILSFSNKMNSRMENLVLDVLKKGGCPSEIEWERIFRQDLEDIPSEVPDKIAPETLKEHIDIEANRTPNQTRQEALDALRFPPSESIANTIAVGIAFAALAAISISNPPAGAALAASLLPAVLNLLRDQNINSLQNKSLDEVINNVPGIQNLLQRTIAGLEQGDSRLT